MEDISKELFEQACRVNETIDAVCRVLNISMLEAYYLEQLYKIELPEKERPTNIHLG